MEEKEKILRESLEAICIISNQKIVDNSSSGFNKLFGAKSLLMELKKRIIIFACQKNIMTL